MTFEFNLTKEDIVNFHYYVGWAAPGKKNFRIKYYCRALIGALVGGLGTFILLKPNDKFAFFLIMGIVVLIWTVLMTYIGIQVKYKKKLIKYATDPNNASWYSPSLLIISDEGLITKNETGESVFNWNGIIRKNETADYIYLFITSAQALIIPKRIMDQKQLQEVQAILSRNLSLKSEFDHLIVN